MSAYLAALKVGVCKDGADEAGRQAAQNQPVGCSGLGHVPMALMEARSKKLHLRNGLAVGFLAPVHRMFGCRDVSWLQIACIPHPEICIRQ